WVDRPGKVVDGSHIPGTDGTEVFLPQKVGSPQLENGFYTGNPIVDLGIQHGKGGNLPIGKGSLPKIAVAPPVVHIEPKVLEQGGVPKGGLHPVFGGVEVGPQIRIPPLVYIEFGIGVVDPKVKVPQFGVHPHTSP